MPLFGRKKDVTPAPSYQVAIQRMLDRFFDESGVKDPATRRKLIDQHDLETLMEATLSSAIYNAMPSRRKSEWTLDRTDWSDERTSYFIGEHIADPQQVYERAYQNFRSNVYIPPR